MAYGYRRDSTRFVVGSVSVAHFLSHFYFLVFPPLFPLFVDDFGVSNTQLGLLFSLLFLMPSVLQVPVGDLVDRVGAQPVLAAGMAVTGLGITVTALANSYLALLGFALLAGVGQSVFHPADLALLETVSDEGSQGKSYGTHTFAGFLGFAAGPLVAGGLALRFGWKPALAGLGLVGVAYAVVLYLTMAPVHRGRESAGRNADADADGDVDADGDAAVGDDAADADGDAGGLRSNWAVLARPPVLATFLFFVLLTVSSTGIQSFTVVFLTDVVGLDPGPANTTLTANLTATALGVLAGGVLADRVSIHAILATTLTAAGALVGVIVAGAFPPTYLVTLAVFSVLGLIHGLALPSRDSLVSAFSTSDTAGKSFGFAYTGVTVGAFVAPVMLGFVSDAVNERAMYATIAVFYAASVLTVAALAVGLVDRGADG